MGRTLDLVLLVAVLVVGVLVATLWALGIFHMWPAETGAGERVAARMLTGPGIP